MSIKNTIKLNDSSIPNWDRHPITIPKNVQAKGNQNIDPAMHNFMLTMECHLDISRWQGYIIFIFLNFNLFIWRYPSVGWSVGSPYVFFKFMTLLKLRHLIGGFREGHRNIKIFWRKVMEAFRYLREGQRSMKIFRCKKL